MEILWEALKKGEIESKPVQPGPQKKELRTREKDEVFEKR